MFGKKEAFNLFGCALDEAQRRHIEAEVLWHAYREATMRSAWGQVHQTPTADQGELTIRLRNGLYAASVTVSECSPSSIREAVSWGATLLADVPENPYLSELVLQPDALPEETLKLQELQEFPDDLGVKERAFRSIQGASRGTELVGSGRFFTAACEIGVANTAGLARYHAASYSFLALVVTGPNGVSSYADRAAALPEKVDVESAIAEAFDRAKLAQGLPFMDPFADGRGARTYDMVLAHYGVGDWLFWLNFMSFNGLMVFDEQSFFSGRQISDKVTGSNITFRDDWQHPSVIPLPFDFEGRTRTQLSLLERGVWRGVTYDGMTAKKAGTESTGHSLLSPWGAPPLCLVVDGGKKSFDSLVRKSDKPTIVATFLNYPSMPDPREAVFTATTRHGTFLVENGEYRAACPPLRLRMRSFEALNRVSGLSESRLIRGQDNYGMFYPISLVVPAMRLRDVDFVGSNPSM